MNDVIDNKPHIPEWLSQIRGLTEDEVRERQESARESDIPRGPTIKELFRKYVITIFNIGLFSLIILQLLFQKPLDALVSALLMAVGITLSIGQERWARGGLTKVAASRRETTTAIRSGEIEKIEVREVVIDDVLLAEHGTLIVADGEVLTDEEFLVDESFLTSEADPVFKQKGDQVYTGSICIEGQAAYRVDVLAKNSQAVQMLEQIEIETEDYSPLQQIIDRVLRLLLLIVMYFGILLLLDYALTEISLLNHSSLAGMIFSLAPNGLFFMILISYIMGAAMISRRGALIPDVTTIEALAQISVLCLGRTGSLTRVNVDMEPIEQPDKGMDLSLDDLKRLAGDYARSTTSRHRLFQDITDTYPGDRRAIRYEMPLSLEDRWSAIAFDDPQWPGVFVIGGTEILQPEVEEIQEDYEEGDQEKHSALSGFFSRLGNLFKSPRKASQKFISVYIFGDQVELTFAYSPDTELTTDPDGKPGIPTNLIPLCVIRLSEEVRQDAEETINFFTDSGVSIKLLSSDEPDQVLAFAQSVGFTGSGDGSADMALGEELQSIDSIEFARTARDKTLFSQLTAEQKGHVIQALHDHGEYVGVMGSTMHDLQAFKNANLRIAPEAGNQAIRRFADIVLLKNSLATLKFVFREGERIVNGLTDVFRIYLTQILYFGILIVTIGILNLGFPLEGKQNSAVTLATVHLSAIAASIFAVPGKTPKGSLRDMLFHFVIPAGILTSIAGFSVYLFFLVRENSLEYAQLTTTYALVLCGALIVLYVEPPHPFFAGGDVYRGNKWPAIIQLILVSIFFLLTPTSIGKELFGIEPLKAPLDYVLIIGVALLFGIALKLVWRYLIFEKYMHIDLDYEIKS
jgi:cation-transporting ATPase E